MRSNSEIVDIIISEKDKRGLSLSELARRTGIAKSAMSRYLNKTRQFPLNKAQDFADVLEISVEYLLGYGKDDQINTQLNNLIDELTETLSIYREQYDTMKEILWERLKYLDQILREDEIHQPRAITTLNAIKNLVVNTDEMFELILSTKEGHFKLEKLKMIIQKSKDMEDAAEKERKKFENK